MSSRFFPARYENLVPYVYGEQPQNGGFIKLNTNESPFPPSPAVYEALSKGEVDNLRLYPSPESSRLLPLLSRELGVPENMLFAGNGSDEILALVFMAFFMDEKAVSYPDITYAFYPVYTSLYLQKAHVIPLKDDFSFDVDAAIAADSAVVVANPNAPTGIALPISEIARLAEALPDRLIVVDEAYCGFGAETAIPLLSSHDNILVVQTMSKARSLAGARLGYAVGSPQLIADLKAIKYSFNSYTVNRLTERVAVAALEDKAYYETNCATIRQNRAYTVEKLQKLGFRVLPSEANFVFATSPDISGKELYLGLKEKKILVRWFDKPRIRDYVRITIGTEEQMNALLKETAALIGKGE